MERAAQLVVGGLILVGAAVMVAVDPIPQDLAYHDFADRRQLLGIANFSDVISNLPFLVVGVAGLFFLWGQRGNGAFVDREEERPFMVFFAGVALTAFGSAYYHLAPDNARLVWDRLPLTLVFTAFLAATLSERIAARAGLRVLWPLVALGAASVAYWHWSESRGMGDLRPYVVVQFYPLLALLILIVFFPPRYTRAMDLLGAAGWYAAAKVCEVLDRAIFSLGEVISGHTLKHCAAAMATYWVLRMLKKRLPVAENC